MNDEQIAVVTIGALAGGFVSGLAGFGTGLVAIGIWLHALPPVVVTVLAVVCSVVAQVQTLPAMRHTIEARRVLPFVIPGLAGVPIGTALLGSIEPHAFRFCMGVLLLGFSTFLLVFASRLKIAWGGRFADGVVGFAGGVLGGFSGLSGPLPIIWAAVRGWGKDERRGLFQAFNLAILSAALLALALSGTLNAAIGWAVAAALPGTFAGAWLGAQAYRRLSVHRFNTAILLLLGLSGLTLVWSGW